MNSVVIVGRAGRDAEVKHYESGKDRATFSLAVNRWDSKTSSEVTDWFNIETWDRQADFAGKYLKKGRLVALEGRIRTNNWTDQSGESRQSYSITATNIKLLGSKRDTENENF